MKKKTNFKPNAWQHALVIFIILSCILDIITFFAGGLFQFEVNPGILLLKPIIGMGWAITAIITYKVLYNLGIVYLIYKYKPTGTHLWAYAFVYASIIIIFLQFLGAYSNITVLNKYTVDPVHTVPVETKVALKTLNYVNLIYYCITIVNLLSFYVYERIYRRTLVSA